MQNSESYRTHHHCRLCSGELPIDGLVFYIRTRRPRWKPNSRRFRDNRPNAGLMCAACDSKHETGTADRTLKQCKGCKRTIGFRANSYASATLFCTRTCAASYVARGGLVEDIACQHCGSAFTPARSDAKYCSGKCRVAAHRAKDRGSRRPEQAGEQPLALRTALAVSEFLQDGA
jgi:hypothetical protein